MQDPLITSWPLFVQNHAIFTTVIDTESATVINTKTGKKIMEFNATAATIWTLLTSPKTVNELIEHLDMTHVIDSDQCRNHILQFLDTTTKKGVVLQLSPLV